MSKIEIGVLPILSIDSDYDLYQVTYKGQKMYKLNERLSRMQGLSVEDIETLKDLHVIKLEIFEKMEKSSDKKELQELALEVENIEFQLQKTWKFKQDRNYHDWYLVPKCSCPKMDNVDMKGTIYRTINHNCIIHR